MSAPPACRGGRSTCRAGGGYGRGRASEAGVDVELVQRHRLLQHRAVEAAAADVVAAGPAVGLAPPDLDPPRLAVDEPDLAYAREALVVPQLAVEILGPRRGREDLDDEERLINVVGAPAAGDGEVGLPADMIRDPDARLGLCAARRPMAQTGAEQRARVDHDRTVLARRRRHRDGNTVDQLVAGVGAVVPGEELLDGHAALGGLGHGGLPPAPASIARLVGGDANAYVGRRRPVVKPFAEL